MRRSQTYEVALSFPNHVNTLVVRVEATTENEARQLAKQLVAPAAVVIANIKELTHHVQT